MKKKFKTAVSVLGSGLIAGSITTAAVAQACNATPDNPIIPDESASTVVLNAFIALNGATTRPENGNQGAVYDELVRLLQNVGLSGISLVGVQINTTNITANETENTVTISANALVLTVTGGPFATYSNAQDLVFNNLQLTDQIISNINVEMDSLTAQPTNAEIVRNAAFLLNGVTSVPSNVSLAILYNAIFSELRRMDSNITTITNITVSDFDENVTLNENQGVFTLAFAQNAINITTTGGTFTMYGNSQTALEISNIRVTGSQIASAGTVTGLSGFFTNSDLISMAFDEINGATSVPSDSNAATIYNLFLTAITNFDSDATVIDNITLSNPSSSITYDEENSQIIVAAGSIVFRTSGMSFNTFINSTDNIVFTGVSIANNLINSSIALSTFTVSSIASNEQTLRNTVFALNGINGRPSSVNEQLLFDAILNHIQTLDTDVTGITNIEILNPTTSILVTDNGTLAGVGQDSIFITTTGSLSTTIFSNDLQEMAISGIIVGNGVISAVGAVAGLVSMPNAQESVQNFARALNGVNNVPTNNSILILYNALLTEIRSTNGAGTLISQITIADAANNVTSSDGSTITIVQSAVNIVTSGGTVVSFSNVNASLEIANVVLDSNNLITSVGAVTGLESVPGNPETTGATIRNLNGLTGRPTQDAGLIVLFDAVLAYLIGINSQITTITSISINSPNDVTSNQTGTAAIINAATVTIEAASPGGTVTFNNNNSNMTFSDIVITNDIISSVGTIDGLSIQALPFDITSVAANNLNGLTTAPSSGTSERVLYDALLVAAQNLDPGVTSITSIVIPDLGNLPVVGTGGTSITFLVDNLRISTSGGIVNTFNASGSTLIMSNITFANGAIANVGTVTGLVFSGASSSQLISLAISGANGIPRGNLTGLSVSFGNGILQNLYSILAAFISGGSGTTYEQIDITDFENSVTINNGNLSFATNSLTISGNGVTYRNTGGILEYGGVSTDGTSITITSRLGITNFSVI